MFDFKTCFFLMACLAQAVKSDCPYGYNGEKCEECGSVFFSNNARIVGGLPAVPWSWPSMAYIRFSYTKDVILNGKYTPYVFSSSCGGTIIDRRTILTAGHCIFAHVSYNDNGKEVVVPVQSNIHNPTIESMYSVYLGLHDKTTINDLQYPTVKIGALKVIKVYFYFFFDKISDDLLKKVLKIYL